MCLSTLLNVLIAEVINLEHTTYAKHFNIDEIDISFKDIKKKLSFRH